MSYLLELYEIQDYQDYKGYLIDVQHNHTKRTSNARLTTDVKNTLLRSQEVKV